MGNDDWIEMPPQPGWSPLHLHRREFCEFNFVGYQNTPRFMGGPNERSEEEIAVSGELGPIAYDRRILQVDFLRQSSSLRIIDRAVTWGNGMDSL